MLARRKVDLDALMRGLAIDKYAADCRGYSGGTFYPQPTEVVFSLYAWMIKSVASKSDDLYGLDPGPVRANWRMDLRHRVLTMLLARGVVDEWRRIVGIEPLRPIWIQGPFPKGWTNLDADLDALFDLTYRKLAVHLNTIHLDATNVVDVELRLNKETGRWFVQMTYGVDGSVWRSDYRWMESKSKRHPQSDMLRPEQKQGEPLIWFVRRAKAQLETLLVPESETTK